MPQDPPVSVPALLLEGHRALAERQPALAQQVAARVLAHDEDNARAWTLLGAAWEALGRTSEAEDAYEQALNRDDRDLVSANALARLYAARGASGSALALRTYTELRAREPLPDAHGPQLPPLDAMLPGRLKRRGAHLVFYPLATNLSPVEVSADAVAIPPPGPSARAARHAQDTQVQLAIPRDAHVRSDGAVQFIGVMEASPDGPAVRDPSASRRGRLHLLAQRDAPPAGTMVLAEALSDGRVRLVNGPLATPDTARARLYLLAARRGLTPLFSPAVERETHALVADPRLDDPRLLDLRSQPFFAIDNEDSLDIDQLMHLEKTADGYVVSYALADAAAFVRPGMALHDEAITRGTSYYMPGLNVPMLPRPLSEGIISLLEGQDRRALVVRMTLDGAARPLKTALLRARVHNHHQLNYALVQDFYDGKTSIAFKHPAVETQLGLLREIGEKRIEDAMARGVVPFLRVEARRRLTEDGRHFHVIAMRARPVERWNSEISVLANVQGALHLAGPLDVGALPAIYRAHAPPPPERVDTLRRVIGRMVEEHKVASTWRWLQDESLSEYVKRLRTLPTDAREERLARAIDRQTVIINQRSVYTTQPSEHHGLGARAYARLTAPMREVVGIETHQRIIGRLIFTALEEAFPSLTAAQRQRLLQVMILSTVGAMNEAERALVETFEALDGLRGEPLRHAGAALFERLHGWPGVDAASLEARKVALLERISESGNLSGDMQRQVDKDVEKLILDEVFTPDLVLPLPLRPSRIGTVMGVSPAKIYVLMDAPPLEVKVYVADLTRLGAGTFVLDADGVELRRKSHGAADITVGMQLAVKVVGYREDDARWILCPEHLLG